MTRRVAALLTAALVALATSSCALVPDAPQPVPTSVVPSPTDGARGGGGVLSPDGFDEAQRIAVRIRNIGCGSLSTGSGFALDEHTLVTNRHVVADSSTLQVSTYDGRDIPVEATTGASLADLAVVQTDDTLPATATLADADPVKGDRVTVVGYPLGHRLTVTNGTVLGTVDDPLDENVGEVLLTDAQVDFGSSGSVVLDPDGRVVGVVYAKTAEGQSFVIPVSTLKELLADASAFTAAPSCSSG